ncbi:MAG: tetratricopeptide repeat protein [Proteobacteria bacterium]|nr:tetratricopeptide repeat protein [Pseudomonadota bacterium]
MIYSATSWASDENAMEAFEEGKAKFEVGDFNGAAKAFRKANVLRPNWKILFNIGQSEAAAKHYGLALESFELYLAQGGDEIALERQKSVLDEVDRLRRMVGSLEITGPEGCEVTIDDVERGILPMTGNLLVAAGVEHKVIIKCKKRTVLNRTVRVSGGQTFAIKASQGKEVPSQNVEEDKGGSEPQTVQEEDELVSQRPKAWKLGWALTGAGGVVLITGGIFGGLMLSQNSKLEDACGGNVCDSEQSDALKKRDNLSLTADILYGVGLATATTGIVMVIIGAKNKEDRVDNRVSIHPSIGNNFAGAMIQGKF